MAIYALFVGINQYAAANNLSGCENDVNLISGVLKKRYAIPDENCLILLSEQATKQNIINGFQSHLTQAGPNDTAIFHFSGHGSQEKADPALWVIEADKYNETLICHDSRAGEPYDLADKELRYLIYQLNQRGAQVITLIDSCHSGNVTRYEPDSTEQVRRESARDDEPRPLNSYIFYHDPAAQAWLTDFRKMPEGNHIALSACNHEQLAKEKHIRRRRHGVFTYCLCHKLSYEPVSPSYRNLIDAVRQLAMGMAEQQTPQLEAVGDAEMHQSFLGQDIHPVDYQVSFANGHWWLHAGLPQGINRHATLEIADEREAIVLKVAEPLQDKSRLTVDKAERLHKQGTYSARLIDPAIAKLPIALLGNEALTSTVQLTLDNNTYRHYLEISPEANYQLEATAGRFRFSRKNSVPLAIEPLATAKQALEAATHMACWERTAQLAYASGDIPDDLITLEIEQYDPQHKVYRQLAPQHNGFTLAYQIDPEQPGSPDLLEPQFKLSLHLNTAAEWYGDVYVSLLFLDPVTGSVSDMLRVKDGKVLRANEYRDDDGTVKRIETSAPVTKKNGDAVITASLPPVITEAGGNQVTDYLKLFVSNFPLDVSSFTQPSFKKLFSDGTKRSSDFDDDDAPVYRARTQTLTLTIYKPVTQVEARRYAVANVAQGNDNTETSTNRDVLDQSFGSPIVTRGGELAEQENAPTPRPRAAEAVEFAVFAAKTNTAGSVSLLDVWAYLPTQYQDVLAQSSELGRDSKLGVKKGLFIESGTSVVVNLHIRGMDIVDNSDVIHWEGEANNVSFIIDIPQDTQPGSYPGHVSISCGGIQVAKIVFLFPVNEVTTTEPSNTFIGAAIYPQSAFASYASENRADVMERIQGMRAVAPELDVFVDVVKMRSGQNWLAELKKAIVARDIFYLFWSEQAAQSEWVEKEWRLALATHGLGGIRPVPLDEPSVVPPPIELSHLHFNDAWLAYIKYYSANTK